jgi:hypothetical protein
VEEVGGEEAMSDAMGFLFAAVIVLFLIVGGCFGYPQYNVYQQRLAGEAELEKQKYEKQVAVQGAMAKKESASLLADAEVLRADGVAKANKIIGDSLKNNESYLRWLWIEHMADSKKETIYIPTEAGLPILEAGKR